MKKFLIQIVLFSFLVVASIVFVFFLADGNSDEYYLKFSTPIQESLIIGTSRASQGLQPEVFNNLFLAEGKHNVLFNYAFTGGHSPYGAVYLKSIKKKLNSKTKNGIFIVAVDPWSIASKATDPNDTTSFEELDRLVATTDYVSTAPNLLYLINNYNQPYYKIIKGKYSQPQMSLHSDGWLEVNIPMDSVSVKTRTEAKFKHYKLNMVPNNKFSAIRFNYLNKTIDFLKSHGAVYIVRLPVPTEMLGFENTVMPQFDSLMNSLCTQKRLEYFNYKDSTNYQFIDGNHLYKLSGKKVSEDIGKRILKKEINSPKH